MLWQKLRISIFLNGCTHEEWETASAFHKNLSVFLELHLLYRTRSSMSSNRPVSYFRQLLLLRHREFESFPFTFETLMLIMHTYTLNWSQLDGHDFKSICLFMYVAFNQWKFDNQANGNCMSCILGTLACNQDRSLFLWGFPWVWKLSVFPRLS